MFKNIVKRIRQIADGITTNNLPWEDPQVVHQQVQSFSDDPRPFEERQFVEQMASESETDRLRRRCDEYFKVIESIEHQRDKWIDDWQTQMRQHVNAQVILEKQIITYRQLVARLFHQLNAMRKEAKMGELTIQNMDDLEPYDGEPVGTAERYAASMIELVSKLPEQINGVVRREQITEATRDESEPESPSTKNFVDQNL